MKLSFPINLKNTDFLQTTPTVRSTWTFKFSSYALAGSLLLSLIYLLLHWSRLPTAVPLWYSRPWGAERLVPPLYLLIPLIASIFIYFGNILIAKRYASEHIMFGRTLFLTSALISIISCIIIIRIVTLVT